MSVAGKKAARAAQAIIDETQGQVEKDDIDVDNLVASIELGIFQTMRALFFQTVEGSRDISAVTRKSIQTKIDREEFSSMVKMTKAGFAEL